MGRPEPTRRRRKPPASWPKAENPEEFAAIGRQAEGRVFLFLHTDDFARDHEEMRKRGVKFVGETRNEAYGTVAVFEDLYANKWDLLMPAKRGG